MLGAAAALAWVLLCVRWFDVAAPYRPGPLGAIPPALLAVLLMASLLLLLRLRCGLLSPRTEGAPRTELLLLVALAVAFRWPLAWTAAVGYTTADGSLSGIVALRIREGLEHLVFVPNVPYSGSLKSHLAAALALLVDLQRAFTFSSVLFYALFVAAVWGLAAELPNALASGLPRRAALYAVFSPAFVTRYSLSNDGNYVEVLALGTYALLLATRSFRAASAARGAFALAAGVTLGLAFWCHILAAIPAAVVAAAFLVQQPRTAWRPLSRLALGFALGDFPGLLWNAVHGWESFLYVLPGGTPVGTLDQGPAFSDRVAGMLATQWPVLLGSDLGYRGAARVLSTTLAVLAVVFTLVAFAVAVRRFAAQRDAARGTLLALVAVNLTVAALALPFIPNNPRYLLFLVAPIAVFLGDALARGPARVLLGLLIAGGALGSLAPWPDARRADERWRTFADDLPAAGIRACYTDFFVATKINFVSEERVVCSSELGPTTTEYFEDYRRRVQEAPSAALVAVNRTAADKLERRLARLRVGFRRIEMMKPVIMPARHVRPAELFAIVAADPDP